jgi:hypothetical protein
MEGFEEEITEPVSPIGQYLNSSALCIYILGVLEFEISIDDCQTLSLLQDVFLPINTRFSSIMVIIFISINFFSHIVIMFISTCSDLKSTTLRFRGICPLRTFM